MKFTLATAAEYWRTSKAPKAFFAFIKQITRVFTFTVERANRLMRYVEIVSAYKKGTPVKDIEDKYGCSRNTVMRYARSAGLEKRPKHFPDDTRAKVIRAYKEGLPIKAIAEY